MGGQHNGEVWMESLGVKFDADGNPVPSKRFDSAHEIVSFHYDDYDEDAFRIWGNTLFYEWLEDPDGAQACEAAYELR